MNLYDISEQAYKRGYERGYEDGKKDSVRYGKWVNGKCSECGQETMSVNKDETVSDYDCDGNLICAHTEKHIEYNYTNYCPNCGANMNKMVNQNENN